MKLSCSCWRMLAPISMSSQRSQRRRARCRPAAEPLEDRCLLATLTGQTYEDLRADGRLDVDDRPLERWAIELDAGADGSVDATAVTGADGRYVSPLNFGSFRASVPADTPTALYDPIARTLDILGTESGDRVELGIDADGTMQIAALDAAGSRQAVPVVNVATGGSETVATSQVRVLRVDLGDGDDSFTSEAKSSALIPTKVAIIGILATVAIPSYLQYIKRSKTTEAAIDVTLIDEDLGPSRLDVFLFTPLPGEDEPDPAPEEPTHVPGDVRVTIESRSRTASVNLALGRVSIPAGRSLAVDVRTTRGDDAVHVHSNTITGGGACSINIDTGGGADEIDAHIVLAPGTRAGGVSPEPFHLTINSGAGDDAVVSNVILAPGTREGGVTPEPFHLSINGGAGNDVLLSRAVLTPGTREGGVSPEPFRFDLDGGAGNDTMTSQVNISPGTREGFNPQPDPPELAIAVNMAGGGGNDTMSSQVNVSPGTREGFNPQPDPPELAIAVDMSGGAGDDTMTSQVNVSPGTREGFNPQPAPPELAIAVDMSGGAGDDTMTSQVSVSPGTREGFNPQPDPPQLTIAISMDGGAGNDEVAAVLGTPVDDNLPWASRFSLSILGGAGNDRLACRAAGKLADGELEVTMDGGVGSDVLDAFFALLPGRRGRVNASLLGGAGNDLLSLLLAAAPDLFLDFVGLIDGGKGTDKAVAAPGVVVKNAEKVGTR
jgi:hypothetical protein